MSCGGRLRRAGTNDKTLSNHTVIGRKLEEGIVRYTQPILGGSAREYFSSGEKEYVKVIFNFPEWNRKGRISLKDPNAVFVVLVKWIGVACDALPLEKYVTGTVRVRRRKQLKCRALES